MAVAFNPTEWRDLPPMSLESLWTIPRRGTLIDIEYLPLEGGLIPDVYYLLMLRYSQPGWTVYSPMAGAMTCRRVGDRICRDVISVDITNRGPLDDPLYQELITADAQKYNPGPVDLVIHHPPYLGAIKFTDPQLEADLSWMDLDGWRNAMVGCMRAFDYCLRPDRMCCFVAGDVYQDGRVIPLDYHVYDLVSQHLPCWRLKAKITKNIEGNRVGREGLWRYRACASDSVVFKTETILVFHKVQNDIHRVVRRDAGLPTGKEKGNEET